MKLVGRLPEQQKFNEILASDKASFVAVYGRRRVGKTYLIKAFFKDNFTFYATGLANSSTKAQLINFSIFLNQSFNTALFTPKNWVEAFLALKKELVKKKGRKVIFIDELPWFATKKSDFISGLEWFWNSWASSQKNLKLIVCGSSASWMINELIGNKGGLHNRVTDRLKIEPFTLLETEDFLKSKRIYLDRYQILNLYMVMGGIPFYLEQISKSQSATQNIERICFDKNGLLKTEFQFIFSSLFGKGDKHENILRKIYELGSRATRENLIKHFKLESGGDFSLKLNELEDSGFIKSYLPLSTNKTKRIYVLSDYYTLFYLKFIEKSKNKKWNTRLNDSSISVWSGLAFEQICWDHVSQIKQQLSINGIDCEVSVWNSSSKTKSKGAQIDLIIDRKDRVINLFEIKYSRNPFEITKAYDLTLRNKIFAFKTQTKTRKTVFLDMITTYGLVQNKYTGSIIQNQLTMDHLFQ